MQIWAFCLFVFAHSLKCRFSDMWKQIFWGEPSHHIFLQVSEVSLQRCCARSGEDGLYLFWLHIIFIYLFLQGIEIKCGAQMIMAIATSLLLNSWKVKRHASYVSSKDLQPRLKGSLCLTNFTTFALEPQVELIWMSCCVTITDISSHYPTPKLSETLPLA